MASFPDAHATPYSDRYQAADFHRLTNRRFSSPITPDYQPAEEFPAAAGQTNNRRTVTTADKRPTGRPCDSQSPEPEGIIRKSSYSSVKEDDCGTAQSFLESVNTPTLSLRLEGGHNDSAAESGSCSCCCRCGRPQGWKPAGPRDKLRSKSYTALRTGISELSGWGPGTRQEPVAIPVKNSNGPGEAPLEKLPAEILDDIIAQLALDNNVPSTGYKPRNVDLISCLLTSRTLHVATINTLYYHITIPHSSNFSKFMRHLSEHPGLGTLVRRLDLSHFSPVGLSRSRQMNSEIQNMTPKTLLKCLELTPTLREILLQEHLDEEVDENVLRKILFGLPKLKAVDFCAASSKAFADTFTSVVSNLTAPASPMLNIQRLGLHECQTLTSATFESLLPKLPHLTILDVSHTRMTDKALSSLPITAQLTHLNLGRCTQITGEGVVDFLTTHPAARTLVYLNLATDMSRYRLLWESDITRLLPSLPATLRSLNLGGAKIRPKHVPLLLPLTKHLEELGLASAELSMQDINSFFRPPPAPPSDSLERTCPSPWTPPTLFYLDLSNIPAITQSSLFSASCNLLSSQTAPLEVLELGDKAISSLRECRNTNKRLGWVVREIGRRGWYVREPKENGSGSGRREWKMGAMWWGMRKCPVAWGEVSGLYGHYMFKK